MATNAGRVQSTITVKAKSENLEKVQAQVSKMMLATEKIRTQQAKTATEMAKKVAVQNKDTASTTKLAAQTEKLTLQNQKLANSISKAKDKQSLFNKVLNLSKYVALGYTLKNITTSLLGLIQGSADYIENMNLFTVVMGESKDKAEEFLNTMHNVLGLDTSKLMQYMGTFKGMANNMGIAEEQAYTMSEGLTKLTYDLASFYNTSIDQAFTSLSSAITGQTKSIREQFKGIDVTMGTLQTDLDNLGIDANVSELSYAEKSILRYISILRQSQAAQGDFARTMESPAQMMKQFTERVTTLARSFANMFIPALQAVLPYILAVTSLLTKMFDAIAKFFGYEPMTFDYSGMELGLGSVSDDLDTVGDSAGNATDKVKEFKKQLQGFDVLNVITSPTDTSDTGGAGGGGGGGAGMIDPALLEAIKNYDNRLDLASDKVKQLEAAIQSFLSKLNFEPLKKSLDNLWESMKLVGNFTWQGLKDFYNEFLVPVAQWTVGEGLPRFIDAIANGLAKIDWDNLNAKLKDLFQALAPFAIHVGEGLLWFFENVLVPLATWTISDVLPNFLSILTSAIKILNRAIEVASPVLNWLWDGFLSKIASFAGGAIVGILEGVADALEWISKNKAASTVLGGVLTALTGIAAVKTAGTLIETAGGFSKLVSSLIGADTKTKTLNKALNTIGKTAKNSKGSVVVLSDSVLDLAKNSNQTITKGTLLTTMLKSLGSATKTLLNGVVSLGNNVLTLGKNLLTGNLNAKELSKTLSGSLKTAFSSANTSIKNMGSNLKNAITNFSQTASSATKLGVALLGSAGLVVGFKAAANGMEEISEKGEVTASSLGKLAGGLLSSAAGGAAIGASFGPAGAAIGGLAGALVSAIGAMQGYQTEADKIISQSEEISKASTEMINQFDEIEKKYATESSQQLYYENLVNELKKLVDVNGVVKKGYEERAQFIITTLNDAYGTEMQIINGKIEGYQKEIDNIEEIIAAKQREIALDIGEDKYTKALENRTKAYKNLSEANKAQEEAEKAYNEALEEMIDNIEKFPPLAKQRQIASAGSIEAAAKEMLANNKVTKSLEEANKAQEKASEAYKYNVDTIMTYQNLLSNNTDMSSEEIKQSLYDLTNEFVNTGNSQNSNYQKQLEDAKIYYDTYLSTAKEKGLEINDSVRAFANERYDIVIGEMINEAKQVGKDGKVSKDLAQAWYTLGQTNKDKFLEKFQEVPKEVQQKIIDKMYSQGYSISSELQAGIQSFNPTIKVDANTTNAENKIKDFVNRMSSVIGAGLSAFGTSSGGGFRANGGIYDNGKWKPIEKYAGGGLPDVGSMFVAGEAGPEWVGDIGGKTGVLNSEQLSNVFTGALDKVMSKYYGSRQSQNFTIPIYIGQDKIDEQRRTSTSRSNNMYGITG